MQSMVTGNIQSLFSSVGQYVFYSYTRAYSCNGTTYENTYRNYKEVVRNA